MAKKKKPRVRPLALCVIRRGNEILVAENYDDSKQETFYRPLGGGIEFGEYSHQTVVREVREEIKEEITVVRYLGTLENIFTYNGEAGHEICRVHEAVFVDEAVYECESIEGTDDNETLFIARWMPLDFFRQGSAPLYPNGLLDLLFRSRAAGS